ncbi:MAG: methyltransferase domain-containing protein [Elusimicrobia bacterium]|nr:methyltransferase domain-containing protein [Elusimicrobiota bacterium]
METSTAELKDAAVLYKPDLHAFERDGVNFFVDAEAPNWMATDARGAELLGQIDGKRTLGDIRRRYAALQDMDSGKSWRDVHVFVREALRKGMLSLEPIHRSAYVGRAQHLEPESLKEFWIHLLQTCNLACTHCLVSSNPQGAKGEGVAFYARMIDQAHELGVRRFYFTGGEPFVREDIGDLIRHVTEAKKSELIILTNATLFEGSRLERLKGLDREKLKFQVSLDGTTPAVNDPIRGRGVFEKASEGLKALNLLGFATSLTAAVTRSNLKDLEELPALASRLGAKSVHLMWLHKRGRILQTAGGDSFPATAELLALSRKVRESSEKLGVTFDNFASIRKRVNGWPGIKYDLGNLCWESLALYMDGQVYPSAALAGVPTLSLGPARQLPLRSLWLESPVAKSFREASVAEIASLSGHPFRYLTGGGDMEHSYFFSANGKEGSLVAQDPYHDLYVELIQDAMAELALKKKAALNLKSGFNPPPVYHAMGDDSIACSSDARDLLSENGNRRVRLLHTNCVLSFDVEKPYRIIQNFYGKAAIEPQKELCCPVKYDESEVGHIPQEVIDRFYGCGSPISSAEVRPGETVLDLGSGAGIDCFIAAKKVGASGKVIGVDMTDPMLQTANRCKPVVAERLGYDAVEFRKGYLENIPADDKSVDLVTSNCVINLSPDKSRVFSEIWRILKDNGRLVVADIVADQPVPLSLQAHKDLWGECISGALSEEEFIAGLEKAGFYGLALLKKTFWKEVEGYKFHSITVRGFKFEKKAGCSFIGQKAIYWGPYKAVIDEEGHLFPRGEVVEVCTDTAAKLKAAPYVGRFALIEPDGSLEASSGALSQEACCATGSGGSSCC